MQNSRVLLMDIVNATLAFLYFNIGLCFYAASNEYRPIPVARIRKFPL